MLTSGSPPWDKKSKWSTTNICHIITRLLQESPLNNAQAQKFHLYHAPVLWLKIKVIQNSITMKSGSNWKHANFFFFFFFFFFFAFPSYISGVHHFWVRFLRMWPFFNPTIKVVTFRLRGWCVLGVFLLPAFTRLGHERQDLLSPCDEMHVCTD